MINNTSFCYSIIRLPIE